MVEGLRKGKTKKRGPSTFIYNELPPSAVHDNPFGRAQPSFRAIFHYAPLANPAALGVFFPTQANPPHVFSVLKVISQSRWLPELLEERGSPGSACFENLPKEPQNPPPNVPDQNTVLDLPLLLGKSQKSRPFFFPNLLY